MGSNGGKVANSGACAAKSGTASTSGSSNSLSKVEGVASAKEVARTIQVVLERTEFYKNRGYKLTHIKRGQNPLGESDWFYLHGYVIIKMTTSSETKFARIDWCTQGVIYQIENSEEDLTEYVGSLEKDIEAARAKVQAGAAVTGVGIVGGGSGAVAVGEMISISVAGAGSLPIAAASGAVIGGILVIGLGLTALGCKISQANDIFEEVKNPDQALDRFICHFEKLQAEKPVYSVTGRNCNHFADALKLAVLS